MKASEQVNFSV